MGFWMGGFVGFGRVVRFEVVVGGLGVGGWGFGRGFCFIGVRGRLGDRYVTSCFWG